MSEGFGPFTAQLVEVSAVDRDDKPVGDGMGLATFVMPIEDLRRAVSLLYRWVELHATTSEVVATSEGEKP